MLGFIELIKIVEDKTLSIIPGFFNQDLAENFFSQIHSLRNGACTHPSMAQIGGGINTNLLTGTVFSGHGNASGKGLFSKGVDPFDRKM